MKKTTIKGLVIPRQEVFACSVDHAGDRGIQSFFRDKNILINDYFTFGSEGQNRVVVKDNPDRSVLSGAYNVILIDLNIKWIVI